MRRYTHNMHWELWSLNTGNLLGDFDSESEVQAMVRDLLAAGWSADDLGVGLEWDDGEAGDDALLPPTRSGTDLAAWARVGEGAKRLSA